MPTIDVNGTTLAYEQHGPADRPALVLSHSLFFNRSMFRHQVERFAGEFRVVTYDQRGQGESASASVESLDMDTLADDAAALIEALDLAPAHFAGNSMGGFLALRLAARRPDLLRSAVAMGSSGEGEHKVAEFGPLVEHMQQHGTREVIDTLMYIMFGDYSLASAEREQLREPWRRYMIELPPAIGDAAHGVVYRNGVLDELGATQVPILAIAGEEDHAYPPPLSENIAQAAPRASWVSVPRAGHSVALEEPDVVNQHLATHLATVDGAPV